MGLEDGIGHQDQAVAHGCDAEDGQGRPGDGDGLLVIGVEKPLDRGRQNRKSCTGRQRQQRRDPQGRFFLLLRIGAVCQGQRLGDRRDHAHRQGLDQRRGEQIQGLGHRVNAVQGACLGQVIAQGILKPSQDDAAADGIEDLQARCADGNRNSQTQDLPGRIRHHGRFGPGNADPGHLPILQIKVGAAQTCAQCHADDGCTGDPGDVPPQAPGRQNSAKAEDQLAQRLQDLGRRRGGHVLLSLEIAPEGAADADEQHRRCQDADGIDRLRIPDPVRKKACAKEHADAAYAADQQKQPKAHLADALDRICLLQSICL